MTATFLGMCLALGLPAVALLESHARHDLNALQAALAAGWLASRLGMPETDSDFPRQLIAGGYGWALVVFAAGGAVLSEIAFRGYALARLDELTRSRCCR